MPEAAATTSGYADNDGVRIHYEIEGKGPPLMIVNWWTGSIEDWRVFGHVDRLKDDYQLILVDMRGHGQSDKPHEAGSYDPEVVVSDIIAVLDDLGIEKTHYYGHSLSGMLGWALAKYAPERFHSFVISGDGPTGWDISLASTFGERLRSMGADAWARGFEETTREHDVWTPQIYDLYAGIDIEATALAIEELSLVNAVADLARIQVPFLLIAVPTDGDYSTVISAANRLPNAQLYISELNHAGTGVRSDLVVPRILEFLAGASTEVEPTATSLHDTSDESRLWTNPVDGAEYVLIPAGSFLMGVDHANTANCSSPECTRDSEEHPQHQVFLDDFWIMRTEVTLAQYQKCIDAGACAPSEFPISFLPPERMAQVAQRPVVAILWEDAHDYAKWVGGQLPSEAEWEKACRGTDGRNHPWGDEPPMPGQIATADEQPMLALQEASQSLDPADNIEELFTVALYSRYSPVGTHANDRSPFGLFDMAGNVGEHTRSLPFPYPYRADDGRETVTEPTYFRVIRGHLPYCAERLSEPVMLTELSIGFRVVVKKSD